MKKATITILALISFLIKIHAQNYFAIETKYTNNCGTNSKKLETLKKYPEAEIIKAFNSIKASGMEFNYPQGGCQKRAEMMQSLLTDINIEHAKIWLFAPVDIQVGASVKLEIKDKNGLAPDSIVKWNYHVAPCVLSINKDNKVDTVILDPSINKNNPLKIKEWFKAIKNSQVSAYTFLDSKYYFFYLDTNNTINGCFYKYEPLAGITTMYDKCVVERELAINDLAIFLKNKLDKGYADPLHQIRTLVANVNNMINFFTASDRQNSFLQGITVRDLLSNHSVLINEAMKYYADRLSYWIKLKNKTK